MTGKPSRTPDFPALLAKADLAGPYRLRPDQAPTALAAARQLGLSVAEIGLDGDFLTELGRQLQFPEHYGANFDALYDCLTDLAASPGQGCLLLFTGAPAAGADEDDEGSPVDTLIAVLQAAGDEWREQGRPLWALFAVPGLALDSLPA